MPTNHSRPAPEFSRSFLVDLGSAGLYRQAVSVVEQDLVRSAIWASPKLLGLVEGRNGAIFEPVLNLRSTTFVENRCCCEDGRRGQVCVHALAAAIHYHSRHGLPAEAPRSEPEAAIPKQDASVPKSLRTLQTDPEGPGLRLLVFLPPNLADAAARNGVVIKLEAAVDRKIMPLANIPKKSGYAIKRPHERALALLGDWCDGKLANLVQLSPAQLRELLDTLVGEPAIYWIKQPGKPIDWDGDTLAGVHEHLEPSTGPGESDAEPAEPNWQRTASARPPASVNPRREAEAKVAGLWDPKPGDYPSVAKASTSMDDFPANAIVVDGSPNYLAIRLPRGEDAIRPLRDLLKTEDFRLEPSNRRWWLRDRHKTLNFLAAHWHTLKTQWHACFTENFESKMQGVTLSELAVETQADGERFKLEVRLSGASDEIELRKALASGRNYVGDEGERVTLLDQRSVRQLHQIEKAVSGQADRPFTPTFSRQLETRELVDVEDLLDECCEGWEPPQAWQARSRALKQVGALNPAPVSEAFDRQLRTYQRIGVAWLWHLYQHQLGGILADEMGLGKTLQALALIECIRDSNTERQPALVVCPASLVENWIREAARFTPGLRAGKHHGPKRARESVVLEDLDLVVTSYGTLRQDAELLGTMDWSVVIGDEAQHIKNRRSQNARTLTQLHSKGRFLLTGTPVENSLDDLLSLFSFLMPGYLSKAEGKLSTEERNWHSERQTQRAAAYILRRTKKEVAPELPDKIETTFFCEFGAKQARFYQDVLEKTRRELFALEMAGANEGRLKFAAFTELLRLRQACVDPRIIDEGFAAKDSAKLAAFDEILDECLDNGSRMLVFSSFVSALQLLADHLRKREHDFCYLDGKTKNRLALCDRFNEDASIPVFLISLKAGGTGLNLTGADTVVHYDPWWNPAAEAQATDRAHRIGQDKLVTSIKLIATNTVEEKVLQLQAKKAALLAGLFEEADAANAKVDIADIKALLE